MARDWSNDRQASQWGEHARAQLVEADAELAATTRYLSGTLTLTVNDTATFNIPAGGIVIGASVWPTIPYDAGTTNKITFSHRAFNVLPGGAHADFAVAPDVSVLGAGAQVNGIPLSGADVSFTPYYSFDGWFCDVTYTQTGTAAAGGSALVVIQYVVIA